MPTYVSILDSIQKGPSSIKAQLSDLALDNAKNQNIASTKNKYKLLLDTTSRIQLHKEERFILPFLLGYLNFEAGKLNEDPEERTHQLKQAAINYQSFLEKPKRSNPDWLYFAQWQIGSICQLLEYPWSAVEEEYLKAAEWDPFRAEALREIVVYRCTHQDWRIAYIYSFYCIGRYLGRIPPQRNWLVCNSFYDWKILKYHISILVALKKKADANAYLNQLITKLETNPAKFSVEDCQDIQKMKMKVIEE